MTVQIKNAVFVICKCKRVKQELENKEQYCLRAVVIFLTVSHFAISYLLRLGLSSEGAQSN